MRLGFLLVALCSVTPSAAFAQAASAVTEWEFEASLYNYFLPEESDFLVSAFAADRGWLHLEARFNSEALDTGSAWIGYNLGGGDTVTWDLTPMVGAAFGDTVGIAPGYKGSVGWKKFELYSEGTFVFARENADSYLYNWSELTFAPVEAFRFGLVTERTRVYQTERNIQRGLLLGGSFKQLDVIGYFFNLDDDGPTIVLAITLGF
jgi:hypothetical protein